MSHDTVSFSFGKNWEDYLTSVSDHEVARAKEDIERWLGKGFVRGKIIIDIGSGSGIHSLAFYSLGAKIVYSFDNDRLSVKSTKKLWEMSGKPQNWTIAKGSILAKEFVRDLGQFDIVYAWGVLHHTGNMWQAIEGAFSLVNQDGLIWIAIYKKGPNYHKHLALKKKYNASSKRGKNWMVHRRIAMKMLWRVKNFKNPFLWNEKRGRGMNAKNDLLDWLGGLPYEVASEDEILHFGRNKGFILERIKCEQEGGLSKYLFSKT